jgi:hypothetical protein
MTSTTVEGPIAGDPAANWPLANGYVREEHFLTGAADAYSPTAALGADGRWSVETMSSAAYKTRVVVDRPRNPRRFNGTVVVDWFNVSGGTDGPIGWIQMQAELIRRGYALLGVSAQAVGVDDLKSKDPVRYASLSHPGDSYSYDVFSQAGQALRFNPELLLGGLQPRRLIAVGESQSASRLRTYINAVHPLVGVYDGFLPSVSGGGGADLSQGPLPTVQVPMPNQVRDDLDVPAIFVQSEREVQSSALDGVRQADSDLVRWWEVAGTSHADQYSLTNAIRVDHGNDRAIFAEWFNSMRNPSTAPIPLVSCDAPINTGARTFVMRAAIRALDNWIKSGTPAPTGNRIEIASLAPFEFAVDDEGNVRGGIRGPAVDAPVARLSGLPQAGAGFCSLFGSTQPLSTEQLKNLYRNHGGFVSAWNKATQDAVQAGFLLEDDAKHIRVVGAQSNLMK